jgi:hypothetical protein
VLAILLLLATMQHRYEIDHILIGVADLDRGIEELTKATGVRPVYGGKHPRGTHNALLSLGGHTYLELIALQPDATSVPGMDDLRTLTKPTPIGWAVSATDMSALRRDLQRAGVAMSKPNDGSRITPDGRTLRWQTASPLNEVEAAPFFIAWAAGTPHPSTTSPAGCTLASFGIASPDAKGLQSLIQALGIRVAVMRDRKTSYAVTLDCPKGHVRFGGR